MSIQDVLNNAVKGMRAEKLKTSPQITLGELILKLEAVHNKKLPVKLGLSFDCDPTSFHSWRGSYDELALDYEDGAGSKSCSEFLRECQDVVGKSFEGYKGGDYIMGRRTPVWVAHYGTAGELGIIDIKETEECVLICTAKCEF